MCVGGAVGVVKPTPPHRLDLGPRNWSPPHLLHLAVCERVASAAAISITYWGGESFILPGSNPESIDERVGGGGGQLRLGQCAVWGVILHEGGGEGHAQELNLGARGHDPTNLAVT